MGHSKKSESWEATRARRGAAGLRTVRQKVEVGKAVVVGSSRINEIVYCYRFPSRPDRVKIGYSSRGLARVAEQSTAFPEKPELVFVIHDMRAKQLEEKFHVALASRQADVMGTEWFDVTFEDLLAVSPALRRATGRGKIVRRLRWALTLTLSGVGLVVSPAILAAGAGALDGAAGQAMSLAQAYSGVCLAGDPTACLTHAKRLLTFSQVHEAQAFLYALAAVPPALLGSLPWFLRRRQVV